MLTIGISFRLRKSPRPTGRPGERRTIWTELQAPTSSASGTTKKCGSVQGSWLSMRVSLHRQSDRYSDMLSITCSDPDMDLSRVPARTMESTISSILSGDNLDRYHGGWRKRDAEGTMRSTSHALALLDHARAARSEQSSCDTTESERACSRVMDRRDIGVSLSEVSPRETTFPLEYNKCVRSLRRTSFYHSLDTGLLQLRPFLALRLLFSTSSVV